MVEALIALAGLGGLALLLTQSKPLPSELEFKKAQTKLATMPDDPDANTVVGKYLAFVEGNYDDGLKYLEKSGDTGLKTLAMHERAPLYADTGPKKVGLADEWVTAAKKYPALFRIFYDRAAHWYTEAWPDLDPVWKAKAKEQGTKLSAARPPGGTRKGLPGGWKTDMGAPVLDGTIARVGSYSVKMPSDPKSETFLKSDPIQVVGKNLEFSGWFRSDGTNKKDDILFLNYFDKDANLIGVASAPVPVDLPFWNYVSAKAVLPPDVVTVRVGVAERSRMGTLWVDDLSFKVDGKEVLKNGSFEDR